MEKSNSKEELKSRNLSGIPSIDKPWLKYYEQDAYDKALKTPTNKTVWDIIEEKLLEYNDIPALEYLKKEISRPAFIESVYIWARTFRAMGVEENEIVPIYGPFFPDICAITCALNLIGAKSYFLKLAISKKALEEETNESKVAVVYDGMWNSVKDVFNNDRFKKIIVATAYDSMNFPQKEVVKFFNYIQSKKNNSVIPNTKKFIWIDEAKKIADYYTGKVKVDFVPNREAFITSSSGTTVGGVVKGTIATNESAISQLYQATNAGVNYNVGARCLTNLPPTASTSLNCLFFLPLYKGMTVINEPRLSESGFYKQIINYKPQVALTTGSLWLAFFRKLEAYNKKGKKIDLSFFDMPIIGGEGINPQELEWINKLMLDNGANVPIFNGYGMSEVFSVTSVDNIASLKLKNSVKPVVSVGIPYPGVDVGIFDTNGNELKYNERGELWIKSPSIMKGYYGKKELTDKMIVDGWLHTGDIFDIDENGNLYMWGRKTDKVTGELDIYLFDIANKIREDNAIKDVIVNELSLNNGEYCYVAHVIFDENCLESKEIVYSRIDENLKNSFLNKIKITGYKEQFVAFKSSPTTAKKNRQTLMNELTGYEKYENGEKYDIQLTKTQDNKYCIEYVKNQPKVKKR